MSSTLRATRTPHRLQALEAIRGFAASYVVMGHICNVYFHNPAWALPFRFAAEAVVLFFLLSGFVVRLSTSDDTTVSDFFLKRIKRIYPLFVLSLLFSYGMACAAAQAWVSPRWGALLGNLLMLQDFGYARPGVWVDQYYNEALWSLAYEWWFYIFFIGLLKVERSPQRRHVWMAAAAGVALLAHSVWPNQLSYFAVNFVTWWAAADLARRYAQQGEIQMKAVLPWCAGLVLLALAWLPFVWSMPATERSPGLYPILDMRRFAAAAVFLMVGWAWYKLWSRGGERLFRWTFGPFRHVAPISYGVYIFHFPIIEFWVQTPLADRPALCLAVMALSIFSVAYVMEIWVQGWVNRWAFWQRPSLPQRGLVDHQKVNRQHGDEGGVAQGLPLPGHSPIGRVNGRAGRHGLVGQTRHADL